MKTLKFIAFYEYKPEDLDRVLEMMLHIRAIREKEPGSFPKVILEPFVMDGEIGKGFTVVETDNPDQLSYLALNYVPLVTWKFVPIQESSRVVELYQKMKE